MIIFATLALLFRGWYIWEKEALGRAGAEVWAVRFPLSVFAGWVSAASFVNIAAASKYYNFTAGIGEVGLSYVLLVCCAAFALKVCSTMTSASLYAASVVWAMVGIIASTPPLGISITAAGIALCVVCVVIGMGREAPSAA